MDISMLEEFVSLVETCSFQETAEQMNISQSALTKHIHKMEEELTVSLFDRSTRSVSLNEFSKAYYPYAKQIVQLHKEGCALVSGIQDKGNNTLRVAFTPALAHYGIIEMLSQFSKQHPEFPMKVTESRKVIEMLNAQKCDFAFASENDAIDSHMNQIVFQTDRLVVVVPASHPLAKQKQVTLEDIRNERFITHQNSTGGLHLETRQFLELCKKKGFEPAISSSVSFTSTIIKMVSQGQSIAVLLRRRIPEDVSGVAILDLTPPIQSYIYALYPNQKRLSPAVNAFLRHVIERIHTEEA